MTYQEWADGSNLRSALVAGGLYGGLSVVVAVVTDRGPFAVVVAVVGGALFGGFVGLFRRKSTGDLPASVHNSVRL